MQAFDSKLLKKDVFGQIFVLERGPKMSILRDSTQAARWARFTARWLMKREARALVALAGLSGVPALQELDRDKLERSYIDGNPMQQARPTDPAYFVAAMSLLRQLHRRGVVHNDLAKEPNLLVTSNGGPAFIDFQLASVSNRRGKLFRILAREDIRHLLKHKRTYCADHLSRREKTILSTPATISRLWMATGKRVYMFVTRRLLGWKDREGAGDRV